MFSYKRFSEQFKINLFQNAFRHGMFLLIVCLGLIIIHYRFFHSGAPSHQDLFDSAGFVLCLMSIINSIDVFSKLRRTDSGIQYMMMPANTLEKYSAAWLYSTLFTFLVYLVAYYIIHFLSISVGNMITGYGASYQSMDLSRLWELFTGTMFVQSIYFLGSVYYRKNPFVKTTAVVFGCIVVISIISSYILKLYLENSGINFNSSGFTWNITTNNNLMLDLPGSDFSTNLVEILKVILYLIPFGCWTAAFFKLKKLEI